jgi:ribosomal protein S17
MKKLLLLASIVWSCQLATAADLPATSEENGFSGKVVETMNTAGYTYILVDTGAKKTWAASTQFEVKVGDQVTVTSGMPMENYHSKTLNRDFAEVYFVGSIAVAGATAGAPTLPPGHPALNGSSAANLPPNHPPLPGQTAASKIELKKIQPAVGGKTIREIYAVKAGLAGRSVKVRGQVVKYNSEIMGKNWLHLRDGSGGVEKNDNDLMVTTSNKVKVGDTVLVEGIVSLNKDFGAGYKYSVILDDAKVTVE